MMWRHSYGMTGMANPSYPCPPIPENKRILFIGLWGGFAVSVANKGVIRRYKTIKELPPAVGGR